VGVCGRSVWSSHHTARHGKGTHLQSLSAAHVETLTLAPTNALDSFGPVPAVSDRARNGDKRAFAEPYDTHVDRVYRYLLYRVREPADAEARPWRRNVIG